MINRVTLVGRLGNDPETRTFESGGKSTRLTVATNESYKDKEGNWQTITDWHNVVVFNRDCDRLKKGALVYVEGKIKTRTYKDANGIDKSITEVIANVLRQLDKSNNDAYVAAEPNYTPTDTKADDDLPFDDLPF